MSEGGGGGGWKEHTSEFRSPVPMSKAVFCLKKKKGKGRKENAAQGDKYNT